MQTLERTTAQIPRGMRPGRRELGAASVLVSVSAAVPQHMQPGIREISHLHVLAPARRQHLATALMNLICQEADANAITLLLTVQPFGEGGPTEEELLAWYAKFGFEALQDTLKGPMLARRVLVPNRIARAVHRALN